MSGTQIDPLIAYAEKCVDLQNSEARRLILAQTATQQQEQIKALTARVSELEAELAELRPPQDDAAALDAGDNADV